MNHNAESAAEDASHFEKNKRRRGKDPTEKRPVSLQTGATAVEDVRRPLPHSSEAEEAILASMMQDLENINRAQVKLNPDHFHYPAYRLLYSLILELHDQKKPVDPVSLGQVLRDRHQLEEIGGPATLARIYTLLYTPGHVDYYAEVLQKKAVLRRLIEVGSAIVQRSYDEPENVDVVLDDAEAEVLAVRKIQEQGRDLKTMDLMVQSAIARLEKAMQNKGGINGLPTGYTDFDEMTNGLHAAEMVIIAARPSMGKTSLVMNIVEHVSVNLRKPTAVFSLEMSSDQLVERLVCSRARVSMNQIRAGLIASGEFSRITYAADELLKAPIFIDDTPSLSIGDFKAKVRRLKKDQKIELVAIDYLQLMRSTTRRAAENRQIEIAEISSGIKAMAKELEIPIIVLAQLNRSSEKREGNRPMMSDLRESGSIEQDADLVALLMRPEYYAKDSEEREDKKGEVELLIAKQRNGPTGVVKLTFLNEYMRFENRAPEHSVPR